MRMVFLLGLIPFLVSCAQRSTIVAGSASADTTSAAIVTADSLGINRSARGIDGPRIYGPSDTTGQPRRLVESDGTSGIEPDTTSRPITSAPRVEPKFDAGTPSRVDSDEFVPVEQEPTYDPALLAANVKYPEIARLNGMEGRVVLGVLVGADGSILDTRIETSDNVLFEKPATEAVLKTRFTPGISQGRPVKVWTTVMVDFKLE